MERKLTEKQLFIGGLLVKFYNENEKGLNVYEFIKNYENELKSKNIDIVKINSVNATLASLASKELVSKSKVAYNDKMVTLYTPNNELVILTNKVENE